MAYPLDSLVWKATLFRDTGCCIRVNQLYAIVAKCGQVAKVTRNQRLQMVKVCTLTAVSGPLICDGSIALVLFNADK